MALNSTQKQQLADFRAAKEIAFTMPRGCYRRAAGTNYCGYCDQEGRFYVLGDTARDIRNAKLTINGKPAREVFEGFTSMH